MTTFDPTNRPTDQFGGTWAHFQCPTCGRLFTLPDGDGGAGPWCIHHDSGYVWGGPKSDETDWTQTVRLTGGASPRYEHDCDGCVFLGCVLDYDLYVCPQGAMPTLVARYSDFGPDYQSGEDIYFTRLMLPLLKLTGPRADLKTLLEALEQGLPK